jgi:hypothetical protein
MLDNKSLSISGDHMYIVGLRGGKWCYITNGADIFSAEEDVRYYSEPPKLRVERNGAKVVERNTGSNRFTKLILSMANFEAKCLKEGVELRGKVTGSEKLGKSFGPATIGGGIGALIGGPVGAAIGAGVVGWISSNSDFEPERLEDVFNNSQKKFNEWEQFDVEKSKIDTSVAAIYESEARKNWQRFYRLRNLSSVDELDGLEFEKAVRFLYKERGYNAEITQASGDFGVDVIATKGQEKLAIQAKRYTGSVGVKAVQEVASGAFYYTATKAIVITNSYYTPQAKELADKLGVDLINRKRLALMWEKANPDDSIPPFDLCKYKEQEQEIQRELGQADFSARTNKSRRYRRKKA